MISATCAMPGLPGDAARCVDRRVRGEREAERVLAAPPPITSTRTGVTLTSRVRREPGADLRPVVDGDGEDDRVAGRAVGADHVPAQDAFADRPELGDRGLRPQVDQVGLDLHPAEARSRRRRGSGAAACTRD